jgi:hypothetical protein
MDLKLNIFLLLLAGVAVSPPCSIAVDGCNDSSS